MKTETKKDIMAAILWILPVVIFLAGYGLCYAVQAPEIEKMQLSAEMAENCLERGFTYFAENKNPDKLSVGEWGSIYATAVSLSSTRSNFIFLFSGIIDIRYAETSGSNLSRDLEILQDTAYSVIRNGEATEEQKEFYRNFAETIDEVITETNCFDYFND